MSEANATILAALLAVAVTSIFISGMFYQSTNDLRRRLVDIEHKQNSMNFGVIVERLDTIAKRLEEFTIRLDKVADGLADAIKQGRIRG